MLLHFLSFSSCFEILCEKEKTRASLGVSKQKVVAKAQLKGLRSKRLRPCFKFLKKKKKKSQEAYTTKGRPVSSLLPPLPPSLSLSHTHYETTDRTGNGWGQGLHQPKDG